MNTYGEVDILIIGFGFSCIPLLRELDIDNKSYTIISEHESIWAELKKADRLDFDLVSSYHSSFYSFDLVKKPETDRYPTAKEFYQMHLDYLKKYKDKIIRDKVKLIKNYANYSLIETENKKKFKANKVVVSTGFKRKIHDNLLNFNTDIKNKTIVIPSIGDSSNLLTAKLIPNNNKVILLGNGFIALDKLLTFENYTFTLDQLEFHNFSYLLPKLYDETIDAGFVGLLTRKSILIYALMQVSIIEKLFALIHFCFLKLFFSEYFFSKHIKAIRSSLTKLKHPKIVTVFNGIIIIKYWPIQEYKKLFNSNLESAIQKGYLLNDLTYFIDQGIVLYYPKSETNIDSTEKTIFVKPENKKIHYDYLIESDREEPRLPKILICQNSTESEYNYIYRNNYLGVIPKELKNIYFIGFTRPTTGGLANITEMQGLLAHKMLTDSRFNNQMYKNLSYKIKKYNSKHYYNKYQKKNADHLVHYGTYVKDVAKVIGIDQKLSECRSINDIIKYLFYPNAAIKFRQTGKYKVESSKKFVDYVYRQHDNFKSLYLYVMQYIAWHVLFLAFFLKLYLNGSIGLIGLLLFLLLQHFMSPLPTLITSYINPNKIQIIKLFVLLLGAVLILIISPIMLIPAITINVLIVWLLRIFKPTSSRLIFNDLKLQRGMKSFFLKYKQAYKKVMEKKASPKSI